MPTDAQKLAAYAETHLSLQTAQLSPAYYYHSLPACVIDSIFSLGVKYAQVENVVSNVQEVTKWPVFRQHGVPFLSEDQQTTVSALVEEMGQHEAPQRTLFNNSGYANPAKRSGTRTLKSALVGKFAQVLVDHGVETFQTLRQADPEALDERLRALPALRSGVAVRYFRMLAGDDSQVKPDRMIQRFIKDAIGKSLDVDAAASLVQDACGLLRQKYPALTPRLLDHEIWKFQRIRPKR